ncbi:unnamed protein product [Orchesella dallaii]|uniref:Uncharacterized protein n=1 Tax=Orchesella dallaii TaxID=48710 RepID=A0ABP1PMR9_9HEXA
MSTTPSSSKKPPNKKKKSESKRESERSSKRRAKKEKWVTVQSQVVLIRMVSFAEIGAAVIIVLSQTVAIAASNEFATRSLTGIWTAWFFFMAAGLALFWSARCTFNGLLAVLVLQIISATMAIPLFTACCTVLIVYHFEWDPDENGRAIVGSSITILTTNLLMMFMSMTELALNAFNGYKCYFLAYGGQPNENAENNYECDRQSIKSSGSVELHEASLHPNHQQPPPPKLKPVEVEIDPNMPPPPKDLTLSPTDILIIKHCGVTSVILAALIFCAQTTMLALAHNEGIKIGIGIWGALYYAITGIVTVYSGWKPSPQSTIAIFVLQVVQVVLTVPLVGIGYYIVAVFGSCLQQSPLKDCTYKGNVGFGIGDLTVTIMGAVMALCGMVQGLMSLILSFICSQAVCGIQCMISGATVYPTL